MAEPDLRIQVFGRLQAEAINGHSVLPKARKARAILAMLALSRDGFLSRAKLAAMLWEDSSEPEARNCLRQALHHLSAALGASGRSPLSITRDAVRLDRRRCWVDIFAIGLGECEPRLPTEEVIQIDPETLLEDLQDISPSFDEWLRSERGKLRLKLEHEIDRELDVSLADQAFTSQRYAIARHIVTCHPTLEKASRAVMGALAEMGEVALALKEYDRCREALRREFDAAPSDQTRALYDKIRAEYLNRAESRASAADGAAPPYDKPSVAVLPFANLTENRDRAYFVDGLIEDVIVSLAKTPWLLVIARNSSFVFPCHERDLGSIGRILGVRYVVRGSFREMGDEIRLNVALVDALNDVQLWAEHFTARHCDVFAVQDELVGQVASSLLSAVESSEIRHALRAPKTSLTAYDYFLRGLAAWHRFDHSSFECALELFKKSIDADPRFATPYALAASCYLMSKAIQNQSLIFREEVKLLVHHVCDKGRDDALALAWAAHAVAYVCGDLDLALQLVDRAIALNPNLAVAWQRSGWLNSYNGDPLKAIEHLGRSLRLNPIDPLNFLAQTSIGFAYFTAGEDLQAARWAKKALLAKPDWVPALRVLVPSLAHEGRIAEAKQAAQRLKQLTPDFKVSNLRSHYPFRRPEAFQRLTTGFRMAGLPM